VSDSLIDFHRGDVKVLDVQEKYRGFFRVNDYELTTRSYRGGWMKPFRRELLERGTAAGVLVYDRKNDLVLLVEQFRIGAYAAGLEPWSLEVVAGITPEGEDPLETAIRETEEEAGVSIDREHTVLIGKFLTSPGGTSETVSIYLSEADLSEAGGAHGLPEENEDMRAVVLRLDDALSLLVKGGINNFTTVAALQSLALRLGRTEAFA